KPDCPNLTTRGAEPPAPHQLPGTDMRVLCERLLALVFAFGIIASSATASRAGPYEDALAHFLADSFDETAQGIDGVAASGSPLAEKVISALQGGSLFFSTEQKKVYFRDAANALFNAETGAAASGALPTDLSPVRLNNRLRRVIEAALGS